MNIDGLTMIDAVASASSALTTVADGVAALELYPTEVITADNTTGSVAGTYYQSTWQPESLRLDPIFWVTKEEWNALQKEVAELRCLVEELLDAQMATEGISDVL